MAFIANTRVGVIRRGIRDGQYVSHLECPGCGRPLELTLDQWRGLAAATHRGCKGGYAETHDFAAAVAVTGGFRSI